MGSTDKDSSTTPLDSYQPFKYAVRECNGCGYQDFGRQGMRCDGCGERYLWSAPVQTEVSHER
jgi:hypothetical protein